MLFLNTKAQNVFRKEYNGNVRDLIRLPERDTQRKVFIDEKETNEFYLGLAKVIPAYKPLVEIMKGRGLIL